MSLFNSEKHFEDAVYECIKNTRKNPLNGRLVRSVIRQPNFKDNGIADLLLLEVDEQGNDAIHIIELKNTGFSTGHIFQVGKYISAVRAAVDVKRYFEWTDPHIALWPESSVIASLVVVNDDWNAITECGVQMILSLCGISVYNATFQNLSVHFELMTSDGAPCSSLIPSFQSTISELANEITASDITIKVPL